MNYKHLQLPLKKCDLLSLKAGDLCLLTGSMYTLRDAGHKLLLEEMAAGTPFPDFLRGQIIFYAGPTPSVAGRPFGAVGPTTASRMDFAAPEFHRQGVVATIGKGVRSEDLRQACVETSSVYFIAVGGAAAYLAKCVRCETVVKYEEIGTEALRKIEVKEFPVFVGIDCVGNDLYEQIINER